MPLDRCAEATCFGCGACAAACPKQAITFAPGEGGFRYPHIDAATCVRCGLCDKVCPIDRAPALVRPPQRAFAAWSTGDVRAESTSGGAFTELAQTVLAQGGAVCGAELRLRERRVCHVCAEDAEGLARLRKSKYVQSETEAALRDCLTRLRRGQRVLFVGTPCQVAGYRLLTQAFGDRALACDLVCGGAPSPGAFARYLQEEERRAGAALVAYDFRDKRDGWNFPRIKLAFSNGKTARRISACDPFFAAYSQKLILRQACFTCPFARLERVGDATIADCWRVATTHPEYDDNRGTSLCLCSSEAGLNLLREAQHDGRLFVGEYNLERARKTNTPLAKRPVHPAQREVVLGTLQGKASLCATIRSALGWRFFARGFSVWWVRRLGWRWLRRRQ